jgi:hypothetical protein
MPIFEITGPDGSLYEVDGPNMEGALTALQRGLGQAKPASFSDRFAGEGAGERKAMQAPLTTAAEARGRPTQGESALLGATQGATLNFGDEAIAGANAFLDAITGQGGLSESYDKRLAQTRARMGEAERANPATFIGSQIVGGVATAPLLPVKGAVAGGALYGGIAGAGAGETLGERGIGAAIGAPVGAALGAAAPHVVNALGAAARGVGGLAGKVAAPVRGAINPAAEAQRKVAGALQRDMRAGNTLDEEVVDAAQAAGQPVALMDIGGEATRDLARTAANLSSEGRQAIQNLTNSRFESQGSRVGEFIRGLAGGSANATRTREALEEAARKENAVNYRVAYGRGAGPVWDDELAQLAQAPVVQAAIKDATRKGANRAAAEGFQTVKNPFTVADNGVRLTDPNVRPNVQFWDYVQRDLADEVSKLKRAGANDEARVVEGIRQQLNRHVDELVPEFKSARAGAAAFFGEEDALTAGQKFVTSTIPMAEARRAVAKLKPAEKELFSEGYASNLIDKINASGDRRNVVNAIFGSPVSRERVEVALGKGRAGELEAFLRRETIMDLARTAMGNSTTARQLLEASAWGAGSLHMYTTGDVKGITMAALISGMTRGNHAINRRVAKKVAELLVSDNPDLIRKATNTIARNKRIRDAVKDAEDYIVKAASPQAAAAAQPAGGALVLDLNRPR